MTKILRKRIQNIREILNAVENGEDIMYWEDHGDGGFWRSLSSWCKLDECNWLFEEFLEHYKLAANHEKSYVKECFNKQFSDDYKIVHTFNHNKYFDIADSHGHCRFYELTNGSFVSRDEEFLDLLNEQKLIGEDWRDE